MKMLSDESLKIGLELFKKSNAKNADEFLEFFKKNFPKELLEKEIKRREEANVGIFKSK